MTDQDPIDLPPAGEPPMPSDPPPAESSPQPDPSPDSPPDPSLDSPPDPSLDSPPDRAAEIQAVRDEIYSLQSKVYELQDRLYAVEPPPAPYFPPVPLESPSSTDTTSPLEISESSAAPLYEPDGYQPPPPPPLETPEPTAARLRELAGFVDELVRAHDFQQNILHCWPKHPEVVEELDFLLQTKEAWRYDPANLLYWRQYYVERCAERVKRFLRRCRAVHTDRASTWATDDYRAAVAAQIEELEPPPPILPDPPLPPPALTDDPLPAGGDGSAEALQES